MGYKTRRIHCAQPVQVLLACVDAIAVAELILGQKCVRELNEPPIIIERFAQPDCTWMFTVCWFVSSIRSTVEIGRRLRVNPVTGIQKLTGFHDHFYYVFIAVILGAFAGIPVEEEDIHLELDGLFNYVFQSIRFAELLCRGGGGGGRGCGRGCG